MIYFKVLNGRESCNGGKQKWTLNRWMPAVPVNPCKSGYHLCRPGDLVKWLGKDICIAEGRGQMIKCNDKVVFEQARIIRKLDTWNEKTAQLFACWCVRQVWHLLTDDRSRQAVIVAEKFANGEATIEELDEDRSAARSAAYSAASSAAYYAASSAARSAAYSAASSAAYYAAYSAAYSAARSAASSAADSAASSAARSAADSAAYSAARSAQTKQLMAVLGVGNA